MNDYKVYVHIFPNNKKYVGITKQKLSRRWSNGNGYKNNSLMENAINKYKWHNIEHKTLYTNLSKFEAEQKEIELIKEWKCNNYKYGYNILPGGNVSSGMTEEGKKRISLSRLGKKLSEETKKKMSITALNKNYKRPMTEKRKNFLRLCNNKKIMMLDKNNNILKIFNSIQEAEKELCINNSNISQCCLKKRKTAGGYIWEYFKGGEDLSMMQK